MTGVTGATNKASDQRRNPRSLGNPVNNATFDPWVQKLCGANPRIENDDVPKIKAAAFTSFAAAPHRQKIKHTSFLRATWDHKVTRTGPSKSTRKQAAGESE